MLAAIGFAAVWLLVLAPCAALASTTTINFETPVISGTKSPQSGPVVTDQYQSQGVVFVSPSNTPVSSPAGFSGQFAYPYLYRDTANAHSGTQVLYAYTCSGEACSFGDGNGDMIAQLTTPTTEVELYAGASGGASVELAGYNAEGDEVAHEFETAGTKVATHMQVTSSTADIAYFSVARIGYGALEIDDLSYVVPATPPAPFITLGPSGGTAAYPGGSSSLTVDVQRFDGADDAVDLTVSGLPSGVTLIGGTTIAAGADTTTLTFSVSSSAPFVDDAPFTVSATSADVSAPAPLQEQFSVVNPGAPIRVQVEPPGSDIPAGSANVPMAPCSVADVTVLVSTNPTITSGASLSLSASGDTTGLGYSLSTASVPPTHGGFVFVTLILTRTSSAGSGDAEITISGRTGLNPAVSATVLVTRTGLTAQGLYVTEGPQTDFGKLIPSGTGASGDSYSGLELVAGKKTVVRLYADAAGTPDGQPGVVAQLFGYRNGKPLPGSPLQPDYGTLASNGTPTATLPEYPGASAIDEQVSDPELESNSNAYTFTLPYSWVEGSLYGGYWPTSTSIKLVGQVQPYASTSETASCRSSESFTLNNVGFDDVGFNYSNQELFPIAMPVNGVQPPPPDQVFQDAGAVTPLPDGIPIIYPYWASVDITDIANTQQYPCNINPTATAVYSQDPLNSSTAESAGSACGNIKDYDVLQRLQNLVQNADDGAINYSHDVGVNMGVARGLTNGIPGQYSVVDGTAGYRPLTSVAHELFHQFGLQHASAACGGAGVSWPPDQQGYLDGIAVDVTSEPYRFIAPRSPDFPSPFKAEAYDLMSYCAHAGGGDPNTWVSPRNWVNLIGIFGGGGPAADVASAASARASAAARDPLSALAQVDPSRLSVTGFVTGSGVQITDVGPQVGGGTPNGTAVDSFTLTARGSHGQTLASVPMAATTGGHVDGPTPTPLVQISGEVPAGGVHSIQVDDDGKVVASRTRPAKAPRLRVLAPVAGAVLGTRASVLVSWRATNPEHLPLTAIVDYSRDAGRTWRTIFVGPNKGHCSVPSLFLTASREARVRVRINDGWHETSAVSGVFTSLGAPPQVTILTRLGRPARVSGDSQLQLAGQAVDQAAQVLTGRSLRWFDGPFELGTGATISAGPLPAGINRIRLVARDPGGRTASATLVVVVTRVSLPFLELRIPASLSRHARKLTLRAGSSVPATLEIGRPRFQLGTARRISVSITPGLMPLLLHLEVTTDGVTIPFAVRVARR